MYASNIATQKPQEPRPQQQVQRESNISILRRTNGEDRIEYTKRCPSCGGELIWLPEKFGEIQQPSGPGPPAYSQSPDPFQLCGEGHYQEIPVKTPPIGYSEPRSSREAFSGGNRAARDHNRSPSRERRFRDHSNPRSSDYSTANREYQDQSYQHRSARQGYHSDSYNNRSGIVQETYRDQDHYYRDSSRTGYQFGPSGSQGRYDLQDQLSGGWYCSNCGFHLMSNEKFQSHNMESKENKEVSEEVPQATGTDEKVESPGDKANKSIDEEYVMWENQINKDFSEFLTHIKNYFTEKENKLKEYQVDLCQREKSLQVNEGFFKERMDTLKKAEEEFQDKVERLNLQVQDRMQRLREYESKITRLSNVKKNATKDVAVQTQASFNHDLQPPNRHSPHSNAPNRGARENYGFSIGYHLINKGDNPASQQQLNTFEEKRKRLLEGPSVRNSGVSEERQRPESQLKSNSGVSNGDYMFMGAVSKTSPNDIAGSPYYIDLQNMGPQGNQGHLPNGDVTSHKQDYSPNNLNGVFVDTSNGTTAVDSGFNTPEVPNEKFNSHYQYTEHPAQPVKTGHVMRPRERKYFKGNFSNNSNNTSEGQNTNPGSARNSVSEYVGERAILVKSPNGVESYTTRAQKYSSSSGVHRSSSVPQNKPSEPGSALNQRSRSPSPNRDRAQSVPPDGGISNEPLQRPKSEYIGLDDHDSVPPGQFERPRSSSFGSSLETNHQPRHVPTSDNQVSEQVAEQSINNQRERGSNDSLHKVNLRSRSSESVRRSHPVNKYHHYRGGSYGEIKKKAQSEMNLSSEAWNEDDDEGIVISHRKSTSFDSPRSKPNQTQQSYQPPKFYDVSNAKMIGGVEDQNEKAEVVRQESSAEGNGATTRGNNTQHRHEKNHLDNLKPAKTDHVYENVAGITTAKSDHHSSSQMVEKPRVRGRRSDMSIPHRRLNKVSYYTASGTNLNANSATNSEHSATESLQQRQKFHKDQISARANRPNHSPAISQYNTTSVAVVNYHPGSTANRNQYSYHHPSHQNGERLRQGTYANHREPERTSNLARPNNEAGEKDEGIVVDGSNDRSNESPDMTSTPRDNIGEHDYNPGNLYVQKEGTNPQHSHQPSHRLYYNAKGSAVNGKIDLTDKESWAIKRRRDLQKSKSNTAETSLQGYKKEPVMNGTVPTAHYENLQQHQPPVKVSTRRSRPIRVSDNKPKEEYPVNSHLGNSEKYPDIGYNQGVPDKSKDSSSFNEYERQKLHVSEASSSVTESSSKRRLFGFSSPKYKEMLQKYGNGGKQKSGKITPKKTEDKNNNSATEAPSKSSTKVSSKKVQGKEKERAHRDTLSPRSKLPQYNNFMKEVQSK